MDTKVGAENVSFAIISCADEKARSELSSIDTKLSSTPRNTSAVERRVVAAGGQEVRMDILDSLDELVADKRRVEVIRMLLGYRGRYTHDEGGNESRRLDIRDFCVGERSRKGRDGDQAVCSIDHYGEDGRCEEYAALSLVEHGVVLARGDRKINSCHSCGCRRGPKFLWSVQGHKRSRHQGCRSGECRRRGRDLDKSDHQKQRLGRRVPNGRWCLRCRRRERGNPFRYIGSRELL